MRLLHSAVFGGLGGHPGRGDLGWGSRLVSRSADPLAAAGDRWAAAYSPSGGLAKFTGRDVWFAG